MGQMKTIDHSMVCAGIDVAKQWLDCAIAKHGAKHKGARRFANTGEGHKELLDWCYEHAVERVGLEASGGYERGILRTLREAGMTAVLFQPMQVRHYAKFIRLKAKTDAIDAGVIALCTVAAQDVREPQAPYYADLAQFMTCLEQIEQDMVRCKTRREGFSIAALKQQLDDDYKNLKRRRGLLLKSLVAEVAKHEALQLRLTLILSVPGIGLRTALALLILMPELGSISREQAASLLGVAPFDKQSGQKQSANHIAGGRARPRRSLFAAALPASFQHNQALIQLYQRLIAKGKPHKQALIACTRKLIIYVNTVIARGTPWKTAQT
jgi:transposase